MQGKVLVVDDSSTIRSLLAKILGGLGLASVQAEDGIEALAVAGREREAICLVLADWNMPRMNGLEFLKQFRARPEFASVPFIMVTTETTIDHMVEALSAGANEYLMKPFTAEMLESKLRIVKVPAAPHVAQAQAAQAQALTTPKGNA